MRDFPTGDPMPCTAAGYEDAFVPSFATSMGVYSGFPSTFDTSGVSKCLDHVFTGTGPIVLLAPSVKREPTGPTTRAAEKGRPYMPAALKGGLFSSEPDVVYVELMESSGKLTKVPFLFCIMADLHADEVERAAFAEATNTLANDHTKADEMLGRRLLLTEPQALLWCIDGGYVRYPFAELKWPTDALEHTHLQLSHMLRDKYVEHLRGLGPAYNTTSAVHPAVRVRRSHSNQRLPW
jgi:hypothetical protein